MENKRLKLNKQIVEKINNLSEMEGSVVFLSANDNENYAMAIGGKENNVIEMIYTEMTKNEFFRKAVLHAANLYKDKDRGNIQDKISNLSKELALKGYDGYIGIGKVRDDGYELNEAFIGNDARFLLYQDENSEYRERIKRVKKDFNEWKKVKKQQK